MIEDINKMLEIVADATTELENKISGYLGANIEADIEEIDYESFKVIMRNPESKSKRRCYFDYNVLFGGDITVYYIIDYNLYNTKDFTSLYDTLDDIKKFLNGEE